MKILLKGVFVFVTFVVIGVFLFSCGSPGAGSANLATSEPESGSTPGTQIYQAVGVVKGLNPTAKEVTIDHEDIPGLMSAMRMTFSVKDLKVLDGIGVGDKIDFELERNGSDYTVTKILPEGGQLSGGGRIFKANCARCHGENGEGSKKGPSFLKGHTLEHPREDFIDQVKNGEEGKMPSFSDKLSDEQIGQVVDYVRDTIQKDLRKGEEGAHDH